MIAFFLAAALAAVQAPVEPPAGKPVPRALPGTAPSAPAAPPGDHWADMGSSRQGRGYIDRRSYRRTGDLVRFSGLIMLHEADRMGATQIFHDAEVDCRRRIMRVIAFSTRAPDGQVIATYTVPEDRPVVTDIASGSNGDLIRQEVCGPARDDV